MVGVVRSHPLGSRAWWRAHAVELHDSWNLVFLGSLNLAHLVWWAGHSVSHRVVECLFFADFIYIWADFAWLLALPECVNPRVWRTLVAHHATIVSMSYLGFNNPVLMRHAVRCWVVEVASWNHIATRKFKSPVFEKVNKPLYIVTRLIGWPVAYFAYLRDRNSLSASEVLRWVPSRVHILLSFMQLLLYGLMIHWGYNLLLRKPDPPKGRKSSLGARAVM